MPNYSFILPVRNGSDYIKQCISSILNQTYKDFDLIVLDNCSTDGTIDYIKSLNDSRIILYQSSESLTIEQSWARIKEIPKNEFMTMTGHDDLFSSEYLKTIDKLIRDYPDASLYQTHYNFIDQDGIIFKKSKPMNTSIDVDELLKLILLDEIDILGTGFMMRSKDYDSIGGIQPYPNLLFADFQLWMELTLISYLKVSPIDMFSFRIHQSTTKSSSNSKMIQAFDNFIQYLSKLKNNNQRINEVIVSYATVFLNKYCSGFSHRYLKSPLREDELSIKSIISRFRNYGRILLPGINYDPLKVPIIRLSYWIDRYSIVNFFFRFFKKIYSKPLFK